MYLAKIMILKFQAYIIAMIKKERNIKMLTEKEEILVADMKYLKIPMETIEAIMDSFQTEEQRQIMLNSIKRRFNEKGTVTEQELLKMMIMITCPKKNTQKMQSILNTWNLSVKTSTQMKFNQLMFYML